MGNTKPRTLEITKRLCVTALFTAMTVAACSFSIPVPGGHLYFVDAVICTAAILLDPVSALIAGGVGAFLGDLLFYPLPMLVSLVTHGLQALVISLIVRAGRNREKPFWYAVLGTFIGVIIMVTGYSLGKAFIYSTPEYAIIKLPYEILQGLLGMAVSLPLCYKAGLIKIFNRFFSKK